MQHILLIPFCQIQGKERILFIWGKMTLNTCTTHQCFENLHKSSGKADYGLFAFLMVLSVKYSVILPPYGKYQTRKGSGKGQSKELELELRRTRVKSLRCSGKKRKAVFNQSTGRKGMSCFVCSQVIRKLAIF